MKSISTATEELGRGPSSPFFLWIFELFLRNLSVKLVVYFIAGKYMANGAIINEKKKSQTAARFSSQTYRVKILPGPFSSIDLILKLLCHDSLGILVIQMCQVHYSKRQNKIIKKNMHYAFYKASSQGILNEVYRFSHCNDNTYPKFLSCSCTSW